MGRFHGPAVAVPIPLHYRRRWRRGYDQARLIARAFAREKAIPCASLLRRIRATSAQSTQGSLTARRRNPRGAFALEPVDLSGWSVWLIDDVCTTGATAERCARLLRRAGACRVHLAVAAVTDPREVAERGAAREAEDGL